MLSQDQEEQYGFENAVRATARMLWNEAALGGSTNFDGRERDGYFETRDTVHIVEATTSTRKQKVVDDGKKTHEAVIKIRRNTDKFAQGWLITKNEPTADQRDAVKEKYSSTTQIMSFDQFRSRLFDGNQYLTQRSKYRFGSILDFSDNSVFVPENEYVDVDFLNESRTKTIPHTDVISSDYTRKLFLVLGEYGSGKSMSLRAAFISRRSDYFSGKRIRCPIYLNLRDHVGQTSPIEALERHARAIGYAGPANDLVRAWRAGFVDLFLDGFDEMATAGWGGSIHKVRSHRYAGMALVRQFLSESQESADIYLAGRENYFDSASEMKSALGISTKFHVVRTAEFSSSELSRFLVKKHFTGPSRSGFPRGRYLSVTFFRRSLSAK